MQARANFGCTQLTGLMNFSLQRSRGMARRTSGPHSSQRQSTSTRDKPARRALLDILKCPPQVMSLEWRREWDPPQTRVSRTEVSARARSKGPRGIIRRRVRFAVTVIA